MENITINDVIGELQRVNWVNIRIANGTETIKPEHHTYRIGLPQAKFKNKDDALFAIGMTLQKKMRGSNFIVWPDQCKVSQATETVGPNTTTMGMIERQKALMVEVDIAFAAA